MKEVEEKENKIIINESSLSNEYNKKNQIVVEEKEIYDTVTLPIHFIKSEAEKKLVKKINWLLLPLIWAILLVQIADKSAMTFAVVLGLFQDTKINGSQFNLLGSLFSIAYLFMQIPNSYLIQRVPLSKYLGILLIGCGITSIGTSFCNNFIQLAICRILLGIFESSTFPCLIITLNSLYRRQEQSACLGFIGFSTATGAIVSSFITYGVAKNLDGVYGLGSWRWNCIVFGSMTIVIGILNYFFLIDDPFSKLLKLTDEEKKIVEDRIQDNAVVKEKTIKVHHYWEALREPRYYLIMFGTFCAVFPTSGVFLYIAPLITSLGFSPLNAILLKAPINVFSALFIFLTVYIHRRTKKYVYSIIFSTTISMIGFLLLIVLPNNAIKLLGYFFCWGFFGANSIAAAIVANNVSGYSKKIFYNSSMTASFTVASIISPLIMFEKESPIYRSAMITFFVGMVLACFCFLLALYLMHRSNQSRRVADVSKTDAYLDLTDREDSNFVYKL